MTPQSLTDVLAAIDADTNAVAQVVLDLRTKIGNSMSDADVAAVVSTLTAVGDRLTGIAANPATPVPAGPLPPLSAARAVKK